MGSPHIWPISYCHKNLLDLLKKKKKKKKKERNDNGFKTSFGR